MKKKIRVFLLLENPTLQGWETGIPGGTPAWYMAPCIWHQYIILEAGQHFLYNFL